MTGILLAPSFVLPLALLLAAAAIGAFAWALCSGQMDDLDTPAMRPLIEEDEAPKKEDGEEWLQRDRRWTPPQVRGCYTQSIETEASTP